MIKSMYKHNFEFGTTPLVIVSEKILEESLLDKILAIIQFIKYDFTDTVHNSSGYRFNKAKKDSLTPISFEFRFYLKIIIEGIRETGSLFFPFNGINKTDFNDNSIIFEDQDIIKQGEFILQTQILLQQFLIDTIYDVLNKEKITSFFIYSTNFARAKGDKSFEKEFSIEDKTIKIDIKNEAIGFFFFADGKNKEFPKTTMTKPSDVIKYKYAIVTSDTTIGTKLTSSLFSELYSENDYQYFALKKNVRIWLYDFDDRSYEFPKQ